MKRIIVAVVLLAFACTTKQQQIITPPPATAGTIRGVVRMSDGSPLPGVIVTVNGEGRNIVTVTDANGAYMLGGIAPGTYTIVSELTGYGRTQQTARISAKGASLETKIGGSVSETITVTAEAPLVDVTRTASAATVYAGGASGGRLRRTTAAKVAAAPVPPPAAPYTVDGIDSPGYARFEDHDVVETRKERVTTFAIDVDRASYANVRRYLDRGLVPPRDAVRIEEMINYFAYHYPQPEGDAPFSITTEVSGCPWNAQNRLLRIGIQGRNLEQWKMAPNNLVFLLDVSGSMSPPDRLPLLKSAFRVLVDQLRAEDRVSIVVYAGAAGLVLPPTSGADKQTIFAALEQLQSGGSTAGGAGIELAYKIAQDGFLSDGNNRVILATDGDFNVGISRNDDLERLIEEKRKSGVYLSVIGVGDNNLQDAKMETLADKGNGNYAYIDSMKEAEKVFKQELTGTLVTIAKDVKVQLEFDPSLVASYRQIGYENRAMANKDFEDDAKDAGELGAGHSVTALFEFTPASNARGKIATVKLRYKEPTGEKSRQVVASAVDEGKSAYEASSDMQFASAIAEFGMLLRDSPHKGTASYADVVQLARIARGEDLEGVREEFIRMLDSAKHVTGPRVAGR